MCIKAAVSDGAGRTGVVTVPGREGGGWLRVESSAICGTDVALHEGSLRHPAVLGHHVVGTVERVTGELAETLGVAVGDRVALEEYLGCGACEDCLAGRYRLCPHVDLWGAGQRVGMLPMDLGSGLHGGNAEYMELDARHRCHRVPQSMPPALAAWILPLANAIDWTIRVPHAAPGEHVAIVGPGYHGLACVAAAAAHGLKNISVVGLSRDRGRLALAEAMGARSVVIEADDSAAAALHEQFDIVVDTVGAASTVRSALGLLRRSGRLVLAGLSGEQLELTGSQVVQKLLTVQGVRGRAPESVRRAIELLSEGGQGLGEVPTYLVALEDVGPVLSSMRAGEGPPTPHVVVSPMADSTRHPSQMQEATR